MEKMSLLQRIVNVFLTPSRAFDGFDSGVNYKDWLYPMLIVVAGIFILPLFYRDISFAEADQRLMRTEQAIANNPDIGDDLKADYMERMSDARSKIDDARDNPLAFRNLWGYALIPVMLFVSAAFFTLILMLIGNFGMAGEVKFFQVLSMVMLTYLISGNGMFMNMLPGIGTLELLVKTPMIILRESTDIFLSPGLFIENIDSFPKQFINQLDIFKIWGVVVMGFGFSKLYNKSTGVGIAAVGFPWLILMSIAAALLRSNQMGNG